MLRLRAQLRSERDHYSERQAGFMRHTGSQKREIERLKKRVAELEPWEPRDLKRGRTNVTRMPRS
ncbi:PH domain-containing protein [Gluconobacter kondonii]|uniref:hypothetical protein n=1 Tax=Gluconobacter kondonii TaxID=941463 RepID=UPI001B8D341E|nr:hypothetical protein [Gluconobacter kondonii]MBS1081712.1 hypothetical protein [Gluconobacter kondonii]MBS1084413.1 hypothetical protein [Gluconobacter kondonii]